MNTKLDELKIEIKVDNATTFNSINMKLSDLTSNISSFSYDQPSADIIQWTLLNPIEKYSHASQSTKQLSSMTPEGHTIIQIQ